MIHIMRLVIGSKCLFLGLFFLNSCTNNPTEKKGMDTYRIITPFEGDSIRVFDKNGKLSQIVKKSDDRKFIERIRVVNGIEFESSTFVNGKLSKNCFFGKRKRVQNFLPSGELNCLLIWDDRGRLLRDESQYIKLRYNANKKMVTILEGKYEDFDSLLLLVNPGSFNINRQSFFECRKLGIQSAVSNPISIVLKDSDFKSNIVTFHVIFYKCLNGNYTVSSKYFQIEKNQDYSGYNEMPIW